MRRFPERRVVLLLDLDDTPDRRSKIAETIPSELRDRVFLLGVRSEPEALIKAGFGTCEKVGRSLAVECRDGVRELWQHDLLRENAADVDRLGKDVRPFLFDPD